MSARMQLFRPDDARGTLPIAYFHAMARAGQAGLVLIEPSEFFVSVGAFDDTARVIDLDFCRDTGIPVIRRETGGGPVLLGPGQVFYTLVVPRGHPGIPGVVARAYEHLSRAPIAAYRAFGIDARLRPINDLVTPQGRKITGQGAADIEGNFCFVGSVLRDFDVNLMCRVLRAPDEAFRARLRRTMDANMTWMTRELGRAPDKDAVVAALERAFADVLGPLTPATLSADIVARAHELSERFSSDEILLEETTRRHRGIKIREGVYVYRGEYRGEDFTLTADVTVVDERISAMTVAGDLALPYGDIAARLTDTAFARTEIEDALRALLANDDTRLRSLLTAVCLGERVGPMERA